MCLFLGFIYEVCTGEDFSIECPRGDLILMQEAILGRMKVGKCLDANLGYLGCYKDVLIRMHSLCSGNPDCEIHRFVKNDFDNIEGSSSECPKGLDAYLQTQHICVRGTLCHWKAVKTLFKASLMSIP